MACSNLDYALLSELSKEPAASQRRLASRLGVSVGKINYCLRALVDRGWVKANNFRRSDSKWAYSYLLTPSGITAKVQLARAFLVRKEQEYEALVRDIQALKAELQLDPPVEPGSSLTPSRADLSVPGIASHDAREPSNEQRPHDL
jgi:MarR family transcriptional regulator, temperature-dependent positive regulator of motility